MEHQLTFVEDYFGQYPWRVDFDGELPPGVYSSSSTTTPRPPSISSPKP